MCCWPLQMVTASCLTHSEASPSAFVLEIDKFDAYHSYLAGSPNLFLCFQKLHELNNIHSLMAVIQSLNSSSIIRLSKTWQVRSLRGVDNHDAPSNDPLRLSRRAGDLWWRPFALDYKFKKTSHVPQPVP